MSVCVWHLQTNRFRHKTNMCTSCVLYLSVTQSKASYGIYMHIYAFAASLQHTYIHSLLDASSYAVYLHVLSTVYIMAVITLILVKTTHGKVCFLLLFQSYDGMIWRWLKRKHQIIIDCTFEDDSTFLRPFKIWGRWEDNSKKNNK